MSAAFPASSRTTPGSRCCTAASERAWESASPSGVLPRQAEIETTRRRSKRSIWNGPRSGEIGDAGQRDASTVATGHAQIAQRREVAPNCRRHAHPDRQLSRIELQLGKLRVDLAAGRDANDLAEHGRADAELRGSRDVGAHDDLRSLQARTRHDIRQIRQAAQGALDHMRTLDQAGRAKRHKRERCDEKQQRHAPMSTCGEPDTHATVRR